MHRADGGGHEISASKKPREQQEHDRVRRVHMDNVIVRSGEGGFQCTKEAWQCAIARKEGDLAWRRNCWLKKRTNRDPAPANHGQAVLVIRSARLSHREQDVQNGQRCTWCVQRFLQWFNDA